MELLRSIPLLSDLLLVESNGMSFLDALPLLQNGILAGALVALLSAYIGIYIILKRIVFVSAALAQVSSLGVACALVAASVLGHRGHDLRSQLLSGAGVASLLFAIVAAMLLARQVSERRVTRESVLGIGYALPAGLTLLILDRLGSETHVIEDILFGNTVFVSSAQVAVLALTTAVVLAVHALFRKEFVFTALDPETATACGLRTRLFNRLLFLTIAVTISVSIMSVGALPVFAFMVIPATAALTLARGLTGAFLLSVTFSVAAALAGFYLSFVFSLPTGPAMLATVAVFLLPGATRALLQRR